MAVWLPAGTSTVADGEWIIARTKKELQVSWQPCLFSQRFWLEALLGPVKGSSIAARPIFKGRLSDAAAKAELLEITRRALEDAIRIAPSLAEDLRSESFLHAVIWPTALDGVADPAVTIDALKLADGYVAKFVEPWVRGGGEEKALARIFDIDRATIVSALEAFVASFGKGLIAPEHWKEVGQARTIEETHEGVAYLVQIQKRLERVIRSPETGSPRPPATRGASTQSINPTLAGDVFVSP